MSCTKVLSNYSVWEGEWKVSNVSECIHWEGFLEDFGQRGETTKLESPTSLPQHTYCNWRTCFSKLIDVLNIVDMSFIIVCYIVLSIYMYIYIICHPEMPLFGPYEPPVLCANVKLARSHLVTCKRANGVVWRGLEGLKLAFRHHTCTCVQSWCSYFGCFLLLLSVIPLDCYRLIMRLGYWETYSVCSQFHTLITL